MIKIRFEGETGKPTLISIVKEALDKSGQENYVDVSKNVILVEPTPPIKLNGKA
jgi:hypothetical protein